MPIVYASPLPVFPPATADDRLRPLCRHFERAAFPRLSPRQRAHCARFAPGGAALRARVSRLLARLLALRALPEGTVLERDKDGRPRVTGAPGWKVAFAHSGRAAFCLLCAPGETESPGRSAPALDAEALANAPRGDRAFAEAARDPARCLRRWLLAEALFKARGAPAVLWGDVAAAAHAGAGKRRGFWQTGAGGLGWYFLPAPGHLLCVALPGRGRTPPRLRWIPWHALG